MNSGDMGDFFCWGGWGIGMSGWWGRGMSGCWEIGMAGKKMPFTVVYVFLPW